MAKSLVMAMGIGLVCGLAGVSTAGETASDEARARQMLDRVDDLYRGDSAHGSMSMKVVSAHWTREMTLEFWSEGKEKSLIRIQAPLKEKGTATLKVGPDIWNYLPKVKRTIKIPSSMMGGAWMGSHITNDDLVKESRMADDYTFAISREDDQVTEITCRPKPDAAVVWGKVVVTVRKSDLQPVSVLYHDEDGNLARTLTFGETQILGGRSLPCFMRVVPTDKPGESTEVRYHNIEFRPKLPEDVFGLRSLER